MFTIQLPISEKLAPNARLLVYTVHPHREVVADSTYLNIERCLKNKVRTSFSLQDLAILPQARGTRQVSLHLHQPWT